jgi:hypothetical protein
MIGRLPRSCLDGWVSGLSESCKICAGQSPCDLLVCAKRQLTWKEMQVALSIDTADQTIDHDDSHLRVYIHDICGSLVSMSGDRVNLVHSTVKT